MTQRRIVSIFLPHFPIERWERRSHSGSSPATEPIVLAREGTHGAVVHDMNAGARALDMQRGARVTDMRAMVPTLRVEQADESCDTADLVALSHWCGRWCPWVQVDGTDGLLLDITGSDHLFGGERAILADIKRTFHSLDLTIRIAIAPTIGSAWALARYGGAKQSICPSDKLAVMLAPLPPQALRLDDDTITLLKRLGLKTIETLAALPRDAMIRRFRQANAPSSNPVLRLDQATGRLSEPLTATQRQPRARSLRRLVEPIADVEPVGHVLADLLDDLCLQLVGKNIGVRRLRLSGFRVDGGVSAIDVATSRASRDPRHLQRLFDDKLEKLDPGFGFETLTLEAISRQELPVVQQSLSDDLNDAEADDEVALSCLADRLIAKLGCDAVRKTVSRGSHVPERAEIFTPIDAASSRDTSRNRLDTAVPLRLLSPPEHAKVLYAIPEGPPARFQWRRQNHIIARSQGPRRIAPEWWREKSTTRLRDYYRVEDSEGRRFWLYREGLPDDGRGGAPRWFVHGLDA